MENQFISFAKEQVTQIIHPNDPYQMNWVKEGRFWGNIELKVPLTVSCQRELKQNYLREHFCFTNQTAEPIYTQIKDIAIEVPFPDEYHEAKISETSRCHTHIWCGESSSYVLGIRMNGVGPHLGLILQQGSLVKYSIQREGSKLSNDRGTFFLHPAPMKVLPQETIVLSWDLHWVSNREEFEERRKEYPNQGTVSLEHFVQLGEESCKGKILFSPQAQFQSKEVSLEINGETQEITIEQNQAKFTFFGEVGEYRGNIRYGKYHSHFTFLKYPQFSELLTNRVAFITDYQQAAKQGFPPLQGAFLCYDNEEKQQYYSKRYDYNGGRERVGMGVLLARYLQTHEDPRKRASLMEYVDYVIRELFDSESGKVFNDFHQEDFFRLYNYPWVIHLFAELYTLTNDAQYVTFMMRGLERYYEKGGMDFYPIGLYFAEWIRVIGKVQGKKSQEHFTQLARQHCEKLIANGFDYPESEVRYEQSIIAPAVSCLLEMYDLTREERYLQEALKHLNLLELFEGYQPDHHLYTTAIRHWDGYWFGKWKILGDTFPHYWSALNGMNYLKLSQLTGEKHWQKRAEYSIRGCLSLIDPSGTGSCAYLYPYMINGIRGEFYDPMANDQDWALIFMDIFMKTKHW